MPSAKVAALLAAKGIKVENDEFAHYGVPGMKWGVRRADTNGDGLVDGGAGGGGGEAEELIEELDEAEKSLLDALKKKGWKQGVDEDGLYTQAKNMSGDGITNIMGKQLGRGFKVTPGQNKIYLKRSKEAVDFQKTPKKAISNFLEDTFGK